MRIQVVDEMFFILIDNFFIIIPNQDKEYL